MYGTYPCTCLFLLFVPKNLLIPYLNSYAQGSCPLVHRISFLSEHAEKLMTTKILLSIKRSDDLIVFISSSKRNSDYLAFLRAKIGIFFLTSKFSSSERREKLVFALLSRDNRWSSKSHHACMFGRVVTCFGGLFYFSARGVTC